MTVVHARQLMVSIQMENVAIGGDGNLFLTVIDSAVGVNDGPTPCPTPPYFHRGGPQVRH